MRQLLKITSLFALALVFTAGVAFGQDNDATVDQTGPDNFSDVVQQDQGNIADVEQISTNNNFSGTPNEATVLQRFDNNEAQIDQSAGDGGSGVFATFTTADVVQRGNNNFLDLDQGAFYGSHEADIDQLGNNNTVRIKSSNGGGDANVYFDGNQNVLARGTQSGGIQNVSGIDGQARQASPGNLIDVDVEGSANKIGADQQDVRNGGAELIVDITGDRNFVPTFQGKPGGAEDSSIDINVANGDDNFLRATQTGFDNTATIDLNGTSDDNQVVVRQQTSDNTATVTVDGMDNTSTVCQGSTCN